MDEEQTKASFIATARRVAGGDLPPPLIGIIDRHVTTLSVVVNSIRDAGLDPDFVNNSIRDLVASYEDQLIAAVSAMQEGAP